MNGWMDGWIKGRMDGWIGRQIDRELMKWLLAIYLKLED
jgi:hypothetical protein